MALGRIKETGASLTWKEFQKRTQFSLLTLMILTLAPVRANDPCKNYNDLGNAKRTVSYILHDDDDPLCDEGVVVTGNWYRFEQYTGAQMPEKCPNIDACGTHIPIWMDGTHPTDDVEKEVTAHGFDSVDCKADTYQIKVKRCLADNQQGVFYVYQLQEPHHCDSAYCAGEGDWCGFGMQWDDDQDKCVPRPAPPVVTPAPPAPPTATPSPPGDDPTADTPSGGDNTGLITGIVLGVLALVVILAVVAIIIYKRSRRNRGYAANLPGKDNDML